MLTCCFDSRGIVHHEYAPEGQAINKNTWWRLYVAFAMLCEESGQTCGKQRIFSFKMPLVRQAVYSPDLVPCDFWLFPKLKTTLKERRFQSREEVMKKTTEELRNIPKEEFKRHFQKWQRRWEMCVYHQGEYFEGD